MPTDAMSAALALLYSYHEVSDPGPDLDGWIELCHFKGSVQGKG